jgi:small subunit ribosomal protein S19
MQNEKMPDDKKKHTESKDIDLRKKEIKFRGKSLGELKEMDLREFAKLLKSNEKRTVMKQDNEIQKFIIRCQKKLQKGKQIKTHFRDLVIVPKLIGLRIHVYNGKTFVPVDVEIEMLGHRLGEFSVTREKVKHGAAGIGATRSSASRSVK